MTSPISQPESVSKQINDRARSISIRFVLLTTLLSSLISGCALIYVYEKRTEIAVSNILIAVQQSFALGDIYQLRKQADSLISGGSVSGIWISDHAGDVIVSKQADGIHLNNVSPDLRTIVFRQGAIFTSYRAPILTQTGKNLGAITVIAQFPLDQFLMSQVFLLGILLLGSNYLLYSFRAFGSYISTPLLDFCGQLSNVSHANRRVELQKPYREIALLETEFNALLARAMESEKKEREAEKQAAVGRIISQLMHDMRSPLHIIERLLHLPDTTPIGHQKSALNESLRRLHAMIESLRHTDLELLISRHAADAPFHALFIGLQTLAQERNLTIHYNGPASLRLHVDLLKFERALMNLASNALDFARTKVWIDIEPSSAALLIRVKDDGSGVPAEFLPKLFQRGATHGKHDGTGLGLAYARHIMRGHGGDVVYQRDDDVTIFECSLPQSIVIPAHETLHKASIHREETIKRVSLAFDSPALNQRVHEKLAAISQNIYAFSLGFDENSAIALTDSEEKAERAASLSIRPILLAAMSDDEIVRRAPLRLGIRG